MQTKRLRCRSGAVARARGLTLQARSHMCLGERWPLARAYGVLLDGMLQRRHQIL